MGRHRLSTTFKSTTEKLEKVREKTNDWKLLKTTIDVGCSTTAKAKQSCSSDWPVVNTNRIRFVRTAPTP